MYMEIYGICALTVFILAHIDGYVSMTVDTIIQYIETWNLETICRDTWCHIKYLTLCVIFSCFIHSQFNQSLKERLLLRKGIDKMNGTLQSYSYKELFYLQPSCNHRYITVLKYTIL